MESPLALELAADILLDHFGLAVQRIGVVLLERGELSMQQLLWFTNQTSEFSHEPLSFIDIRNALLVLVQHNLVMARPSIPLKPGDVVPYLYRIDLKDVLSRMRFARYLEYTQCRYGYIACECLFSVLCHGRVSKRVIFLEVQDCCEGGVDSSIIEDSLGRLYHDELLQVVRPYMEQAVAANTAADEGEENKATGVKRKVSGNDCEAPKDEPVFQVSTHAFNLCLVKMLLCKQYEDTVQSQLAAEILDTLLTEVKTVSYNADLDEQMHSKSSGRDVIANWMTFPAVEERARDLGHIEGRNPVDEQHLRKVLDLMSRSKSSILQHRIAKSDSEWRINWVEAVRKLKENVTSQLIREKFGSVGLRIYNLLNNHLEMGSNQKMEDTFILEVCMVEPVEGRQLLNSMVRNHVLKWQQVATSADERLVASDWLYYVDRASAELTIVRDILQAVLNLRVRARSEVKKGALLDALPEERLTAEERRRRNQRYRMQDILERSHLVMDSALLVLEVS